MVGTTWPEAPDAGMLAQMFEAAPGIAVLLREPGHLFDYANAAFARLIGHRPARGTTVAAALPDAVGQPVIARLDEVMRTGKPVTGRTFPVEIRRSADEPPEHRLLNLVYHPIVEADGTISSIFVQGNDVTDQVRAEERLALSESALRLAVEVAGIGTWDVDPATGTLLWNAETRAMFGIHADGPCGMEDFYACLHPDDLAATTAAFASALDPAQRATYDVEYRTIGRDDGVLRWVAAKGRGMFDAAGTCTRAIGIAIDITQRREAQEALREIETRFQTVADSAPALIWMCDEAGALVFANRWHEETFGRPLEELLGLGWQAIIHPGDADGFCAAFDRAFAAREPFACDVRVIDRHGAVRWLHSEARPRLVQGRFAGYVGCDVDVTEAHLVSQALEQGIERRTGELAASNRQLSAEIEERGRVEATLRQMQRLEAIGQLTAGVAHDFNNLLTVILGNVDMVTRAARSAKLDDRTLKRLGYMRTAAERGATLTRQLLAFSRRQRLEARAIDLNDTVAGMRDLLQSSMGGSVQLDTRLDEALWPALVDPTQIELIILNLAINARDAMEVGGALIVSTGNVTLGLPTRPEEPEPGDYVLIAVADSGTGMTPEVQAKAFEPFFTTKEVGKGSGLGLAQVYGFATQSGGGVGIDTEFGRGTTIKVYLPRAHADDGTGPATAPEPPAAMPASAAGRHILLVDDDPAVREVTAAALTGMRAAVTEADGGAAALRLLDAAKGRFDLMVVDFAMPGMNGAELATEAVRRFPGLPVLYVTGYADLTALAAVGEEMIVQKPFAAEDLQRKVARALAPRIGD